MTQFHHQQQTMTAQFRKSSSPSVNTAASCPRLSSNISSKCDFVAGPIRSDHVDVELRRCGLLSFIYTHSLCVVSDTESAVLANTGESPCPLLARLSVMIVHRLPMCMQVFSIQPRRDFLNRYHRASASSDRARDAITSCRCASPMSAASALQVSMMGIEPFLRDVKRNT